MECAYSIQITASESPRFSLMKNKLDIKTKIINRWDRDEIKWFIYL